MTGVTDQGIYDFLAALVTVCVVGYALILLLKWLVRSRPDLSIGAPVAVAVAVRILAAIAVTETGIAGTLRGGDENAFLASAGMISHTAFGGAQWTDALFSHLYEFVFALQLGALDSSDLSLRITQAGISVAGLVLLAVAVYELAGARPALIAAWILALEPTNVFFSTLLHKEPDMLLAGGLVAFGGATMWKRGDLRSLFPIALGCLIAVATRPYAGWFLIAAGAAITLHAGIRSRRAQGRSASSLALIALVILFAAISAPTVWEASTDESLDRNLQQSQDANAADSSNLKLEKVDFSTREAIIVNLPQRTSDVLLRPYPWQLENTSQQLGLIGTLVALTCFLLLARALWDNRGQIMERAGPLVYVMFFLLVAYSLSAGNAGTAFRYRMHVVAVALCLLLVLRMRSAPEPVPVAATPRQEPELAPVR